MRRSWCSRSQFHSVLSLHKAAAIDQELRSFLACSHVMLKSKSARTTNTRQYRRSVLRTTFSDGSKSLTWQDVLGDSVSEGRAPCEKGSAGRAEETARVEARTIRSER